MSKCSRIGPPLPPSRRRPPPRGSEMTARAGGRWGRRRTGTRTGCPPLPSLLPVLLPPLLLPRRSHEGKPCHLPAAAVRTYWPRDAKATAYCWPAARMPAQSERESVNGRAWTAFRSVSRWRLSHLGEHPELSGSGVGWVHIWVMLLHALAIGRLQLSSRGTGLYPEYRVARILAHERCAQPSTRGTTGMGPQQGQTGPREHDAEHLGRRHSPTIVGPTPRLKMKQ